MYERPEPTATLADIAPGWQSDDRTWTSDACTPNVDLTDYGRQVLHLGDHPLLLDDQALAQLCAFYAIPTAFFGRLTSEERHYLMNSRIAHADGEITITYNRHGVTDIRKPSQARLDPQDFIHIARQLTPDHTLALDHWHTADDVRLDLLTHPELAPGIDGGIRLAQNRKNNLAPTVAPLLYHCETTAIIQIPDASLRIDSRNQPADKIIHLLQGEALRAQARLSHDAKALRALFAEPLDNEVTRLQRVADEHGIPVRSLADVSMGLAAEETPTLATLALAIAGAANNPKLAPHNKRGARTKLQTIAGAVVSDHAQRCTACQALIPAAA